jgi:ribosomal protein S18 acetylase RimI-like enzyme
MHGVIAPAVTPEDVAAVADLFRAYQASLAVDLCFQGFAEELAGLPGRYAPPGGVLLLARDGAGTPLGCAALRPLGDSGGEMKRLYVAPAGRGIGLGRRLAAAIVSAARAAGYGHLALDTLPDMASAQALYRSMGFVEVAPWSETPVAGTLFMRLDLAGAPRG